MQKGINKVILIGNLGNNPEVRATTDGRTITSVSLATSDSWTNKSGQKQEKTEWHRIVVFGKLAEIASQYLKKGSQVYFEGKLATKKWQDKAGQERYTTEVIVDSFSGVMQMLGGGRSEQTSNTAENNSPTQNNNQAPVQPIEPMAANPSNTTVADSGDDEYPF